MIGDNIKQMRLSKGWSQEELGLKIHITRQTISKWEKGLSVPDAGTVVVLADVFGCWVSVLLESEDSDQLKILNCLLARRDDRWTRFWKVFLIVCISVVVFWLLIALFGTAVRFE